MTTALEIKNIGKEYYYGNNTSALALRDILEHALRAPFGRSKPEIKEALAKNASSQKGKFWAIRDINLDIKFGEVVGILGRNGAGKSTLLKVLARVIRPSTGTIKIRGNLGALLEVGTGFNSELTGLENIYLNGALLGMDSSYVKKHLDEIIEFSEIENFINTPIKFYSTGMQTRLAFAVAAHLDPDILIADEVLAVGDSKFQKKCLDKMDSLGKEGRTVIFVSHSMPMINRLCQRGVLLQSGSIIADGPVEEVSTLYMKSETNNIAEVIWNEDTAPGDHIAKIYGAKFVNTQNMPEPSPDIRNDHWLEIDYSLANTGKNIFPNFHIYNDANECVFISGAWWHEKLATTKNGGRFRARAKIPGNLLNEGFYSVLVAVTELETTYTHAIQRDAISFHVIDRSEGDGARGDYQAPMIGAVRPLIDWEIQS